MAGDEISFFIKAVDLILQFKSNIKSTRDQAGKQFRWLINVNLLITMEGNSIPTSKDLASELVFTTSRSNGPGGQNVNKVNSKVTLKLDVTNSMALSEDQKAVIKRKLATRMTNEGVLILTAQDSRSQLQNKEEVVSKLNQLLVVAFTPRKARKATKPTKAAAHKRINQKKRHSQKKEWRQRPE
jgi:ribosome-associated protein